MKKAKLKLSLKKVYTTKNGKSVVLAELRNGYVVGFMQVKHKVSKKITSVLYGYAPIKLSIKSWLTLINQEDTYEC